MNEGSRGIDPTVSGLAGFFRRGATVEIGIRFRQRVTSVVAPRRRPRPNLDASALESEFEAVANFLCYGNLPADHLIMNKPKIIAYLKPTCGWSQGVRAILRKYDLPFEDRDIINDPLQRQEMIEKSGQMLSPCVEVDGHMLPDISGDEV